MKSSWISDNTRITVYKVGTTSVCETEFIGKDADLNVILPVSSSSLPRGTRANRMKELIADGSDKATIRKILSEEGYEFNPPGIFHSEYARLSRK